MMIKRENPGRSPEASPQVDAANKSAEAKLTDLTSIFDGLNVDPQPDVSTQPGPDEQYENRLVRARLGVASSLFLALRAKHAPTAAHSVRVALVCSSWSALMQLGSEVGDEIEIAALLHDIGKIGVPDHLLSGDRSLSDQEQEALLLHSQHAREILEGCCAAQNIVSIVYYAASPYAGRDSRFDRSGEQLPLGSRMLAIANAFDELTALPNGGRAHTHQRAIQQLQSRAGTHFDPDLVREFDEFLRGNHGKLSGLVSRRWLENLAENQAKWFWRLSQPAQQRGASPALNLFYEQLLETMHTGAVFIDTRLNIIKWSRASRDLTGIDTASIERRQWDPGLLGLRDENYKLITRDKCPVIAAVTEGTNSSGRYMLVSSNHEKIAIDLCASPVLGPDGEVRGATLVLHDASSHVNLEERLQSLNKKASQDGLTGVANRAEFDRTHADWFQMHLERGLPYSLIICDLDFFKRINDTYGHQAGDEGLISFGALLRKYCRSNDLVARYGGEEFVILCADCDSEAAEARAENIREASASQPHHMLNGTRLTASFGVTGLQGGDTAETMLRRADRALLQAKADGRNTVVHLGRPTAGRRDQKKHRLDWLCWWKDKPGKHLLQRCLLTPVPIELAMEKLRGFVVNHAAQILEADEDQLVLQIDGKQLPLMRRSGDRPTSLLVELHLEETRQASEDRPGCRDLRTAVRVTIRPKRQRDRRRSDADERARQLLASLKSYLMAQD